MAHLNLELTPKTRAIGLRLVQYALLAALALDILDLFLTQPPSGVIFNVGVGALLMIALFIYNPWKTAFDTRAAEERIASQTSGLGATIQVMNKMAEDMSSGTRREVASLEGAVARMADTVETLGKALPGLEKKVSQIETGLGDLGGRLAALQDEAAASSKSLVKMGEADSEFQTRLDEAGELAAEIRSSVESVALTLAKMGVVQGTIQSRVQGLERGVTVVDGSIGRLGKRLTSVEKSASEVNRKTDALGRKSSAIESRVAAVTRNQVEMAVTGRRVARIERDLAKLARAGKASGARRSQPKTGSGRPARRKTSKRKPKPEKEPQAPTGPQPPGGNASPPAEREPSGNN